jgi:polyribonucleotide nucleotidyltransferase
MLPADVKNISNILEIMAELEGVISELYKTAGDLWEEDRNFWSALAQAELAHAEYIRKMADILNEKPREFEIGRPLAAAGIRTVISGVQNNIQKLKKGEIHKKQILFISRDIEQSLLESRYAEILKTKDTDYQKLIYDVALQTEGHKSLLIKKIEEAK